jgi:multisubunit Na+/H+ antiporter MnhG subunit
VDTEHRTLPVLAMLTGLAWMGAVLLVSANLKDVSLAGDLAYDRANRVHTLALIFLLATAMVMHRTVRSGGLSGRRATITLIIGAALMLVGNVVSFWGALVVGEQSDRFWGGWIGWLTYLPGQLILLGAFIGLARAARHWPDVGAAQRWSIGLVGLLLSITTATWAVSPLVTLAPAVLAAFALLTAGTVVARAAASTGSPDRTPEALAT